MAGKTIVSLQLITDHDFIHHAVNEECPCRPEQITDDIWKHQPQPTQETKRYRTYQLYSDGTYDMVLPDEKTVIHES